MESALYTASLASIAWAVASITRIFEAATGVSGARRVDRGLPPILVPLVLIGLAVILEHARLYGPGMNTPWMSLAVGFVRRCMGGAWLFFCTVHYKLYSIEVSRHRLSPWLLGISAAANVLTVVLNLGMGPGVWDTASMTLMVAIAFYAGVDAVLLFTRQDVDLPSSRAGIRIAMMTMLLYPVILISDAADVRFPGFSHGRPMWSQTNPLYLLCMLALLEPAVARSAGHASPELPEEEPDGNDSGMADSLSGREAEALKLIMEGKRYKEIAAELGITLPTVKSHVSSAYRKLGVKGRADLHRRSLPKRPQ